jgi:phosphatidylserine/phosphatidylglycerophosphate/cardiolipin synthase-like enzyme
MARSSKPPAPPGTDSPTKGRRRPPLHLHAAEDGALAAAVGPGAGIQFVATVFPKAAEIIRIATAYFRLTGYRLARPYIASSVRLHILVGREDGQNLKAAIVEEIARDLVRPDVELWDAVQDLGDRIRSGRFFIRDARRIQTRFHCKFYICDAHSLWHGSANYTQQGLEGNAEQASLSTDAAEVERFITWYDEVARDSDDILAELLKRLDEWLQLASPFDVYLSALQHLIGAPAHEFGPRAHIPLYYQRAVIRTVVEQVERYNGAIAVVATGLGKTVIGADIAWRLVERERIDRVILFAPRPVHEQWKEQLNARGVVAELFTGETLFRTAVAPAPGDCRREPLIA